ncbi:hypothetical protein BCR44DRAFT_1499014 [Catenaria anguillulae PL171]|uniref:AN1-type domain-containing protein n=1 Tax=Catenaria anguillulae PL171 TaxID=765915 RepID=A0A1Y2HNG4_9FUNG|nr:hypothetical protein BCR44DRAFT_1499014 [Catenaria anguillulae PL171]
MEFHDLGDTCSHADCGLHDFLPITCASCQHTFCKDHAAFDAHSCPMANASKPADLPPASVPSASQACAVTDCAARDQRIFPAAATVGSPPPSKPKPKKKLPILEIMKLKQTAKGLASIPSQDRIGRALDTAFQATGKSWDATVVSHTIILLNAESQETLPTDAVLKTCVENGVPLVLKLVPK